MKIGGLEICLKGVIPKIKRYEIVSVFSYKNDSGEIKHETIVQYPVTFFSTPLSHGLYRKRIEKQLIESNGNKIAKGEKGLVISRQILYKQN
jgi:hypothetical protein